MCVCAGVDVGARQSAQLVRSSATTIDGNGSRTRQTHRSTSTSHCTALGTSRTSFPVSSTSPSPHTHTQAATIRQLKADLAAGEKAFTDSQQLVAVLSNRLKESQQNTGKVIFARVYDTRLSFNCVLLLVRVKNRLPLLLIEKN